MMKLHESGENYLETILVLEKKNGYVRSIDIANEMNFSKPSVSVAMKNLRNKNHISIDNYGFITLTPSGREIATAVYERHTVLSNWLISMGVAPEVAAEDACKMEHAISDESFEAIKRHTAGFFRE
mgnify:CR=1 FL=1